MLWCRDAFLLVALSGKLTLLAEEPSISVDRHRQRCDKPIPDMPFSLLVLGLNCRRVVSTKDPQNSIRFRYHINVIEKHSFCNRLNVITLVISIPVYTQFPSSTHSKNESFPVFLQGCEGEQSFRDGFFKTFVRAGQRSLTHVRIRKLSSYEHKRTFCCHSIPDQAILFLHIIQFYSSVGIT